MQFKAFKMDGLGNDFVIIDQRLQNLNLSKDQIVKICKRNFIGCDQLIFINKSQSSHSSLVFYNSDGSISGACGNGTRCVARLLSIENKQKTISLETSSGILNSNILDNNLVETNIGKATIEWNKIPLSKKVDTKNLGIKIKSKDNSNYIDGIAVNVGNPHVIFFVENIDNFDIQKIGPEIENHELFPEKCNVTFAKVINKNKILVRVWERGAGLTKACGTAACATAFAGFLIGLTSKKTDIQFELGFLSIRIENDFSIYMSGPVSEIKEIEVII
ncbi:MAG: diaminopimelate epimerase [Candidatus Pelagibacter sp.]|nr:diaminopimelate epimerase [Candidatus Pelagibacter sp.]